MIKTPELNSLSLRISEGELYILDQRKIPFTEEWILISSISHMVEVIQSLAVRGAPLIGVSAALALARFSSTLNDFYSFKASYESLRSSRPTAVNLMNALDEMWTLAESTKSDLGSELFTQGLWKKAEELYWEDVRLCELMAKRGSALIQDGDQVLTHCNTGGLATVGIGTALGVIRMAHEQGKRIHVWVDETRPLFQGSRLTAWELSKLGIPHTIICDNMAAALMAQGRVNSVFVGADRIAKNGDIANKIGTYGLAVLAHFHRIPFYVVAPKTTRDATALTGRDIPIEERNPEEVRFSIANPKSVILNPAFDVTPHSLITAIL